MLFFNFQSPRNGEDLSDAEGEHEANSHDEAAVRHRDSSPEDNQNGQVRLKVRILKYQVESYPLLRWLLQSELKLIYQPLLYNRY